MSALKDRLALAMRGPPKVSQAALARACKVSPQAVNAWVRGTTKEIEGANLLAAATALNVNPDWLATGKGPMRGQVAEVQPQSQSVGLDPAILSEALKWLDIFEDQRGMIPYAARGQRLIAIYERLVADGGQAGPATFAEFMSYATDGRPTRESEEDGGRKGTRPAGKGGD